MQVSYSDQIVDLVGEGYDAAVRIGALPDSSLVVRRIAPVRARVVASPEYIERHGAPEALEELGAHEALLQCSAAWRLTNRGKVVAGHPRGRFRADNGVAIAAAALAGLGIALLPDFLTDQHIETGALVVLLSRHAPPDVSIYLVFW